MTCILYVVVYVVEHVCGCESKEGAGHCSAELYMEATCQLVLLVLLSGAYVVTI